MCILVIYGRIGLLQTMGGVLIREGALNRQNTVLWCARPNLPQGFCYVSLGFKSCLWVSTFLKGRVVLSVQRIMGLLETPSPWHATIYCRGPPWVLEWELENNYNYENKQNSRY